jgi:hypothetical protein
VTAFAEQTGGAKERFEMLLGTRDAMILLYKALFVVFREFAKAVRRTLSLRHAATKKVFGERCHSAANTYCRRGTGARTCSSVHSPYRRKEFGFDVFCYTTTAILHVRW